MSETNAIVIHINGDVKNLNAAINKAEQNITTFKNSVQNVTNNIHAQFNKLSLSAASAGVAFQSIHSAISNYIISPLSGAVNAFVEFGDKFAKTSQRVGMSAETLGGIKFAAEQCGAGFDEAIDAVKTFQEQLGAAKLGDAGAIGKLGDVGIHAVDFEGLDGEEQFLKLADHIAAIGDRAEQTRTAIELFGDAGFKLLPFFQEGSEGIKKLMAEGRDIGAVLGEDAAAGAASLGDSMNRMKTSCTNVSNLLVSQLAPAMTNVFNGISSVVSGLNAFYSANRSTINIIAEAGTVFGAAFAIVANGKIIIGGLVASLVMLKTALLAISPLSIIVTGFAAGMLYWQECAEKAREAQYALNSEQEKNLRLLNDQQGIDQKRIERLKELQALSEKDTLNNSEVEEANRLTAELSKNYGDLGIQIDAASGKIVGMTAAQKKLNEEMNKARADALEKWLKEAKSNNETQTKQASDLENRWSNWTSDWSIISYATGGKEKDLENATALRQGVADRGLEIAEKEAELKRLRGGSAEESTTPQTTVKKTSELTASNRAARTEQEEARKALAERKVDTDLMDSLEKAFAELADKVAEKYRNLEEEIDLARKAGDDAAVASLQSRYVKIADWEASELKKIQDGETQKQQTAAQKESDEWKAANPDLVRLPTSDKRLQSANDALEAAKESHAEAVLGEDADAIAQSEAQLKKAELALARIVAIVSGEDLAKAKKEAQSLRDEYAKQQSAGADNATLNAIAEQIVKADELVAEKRRDQNDAIGQLESAIPRDAEIQEAAEAVRVSSRGTFSAYGLDSAVGADIPKQSLDQLKKICQTVLGIYEQKGSEGFVL